MPSARVVDFCDDLVTELSTGPFPGGVSPDTLARTYSIAVEKADQVTGRNVYVVPGGYGDGDRLTRGENLEEYRVGIVVLQRYTGAGRPPNSWVDELVYWTEQAVWDRIADIENYDAVIDSWPETGDVSVYDPAYLQQLKLFWSEIEVSFRKRV